MKTILPTGAADRVSRCAAPFFDNARAPQPGRAPQPLVAGTLQ